MKRLIYKTLICCAMVLPFTQVEAKTYGGFKPGDKFTLTVNFRVSNKTVGTVTKQNVPVPSGMPDFKMGSKVTFTIGANGQLAAKGMSLPFKAVDTTSNPGSESNLYVGPPKKNYPFGDSGTLIKKPNGKPKQLSLSFSKISVSGGVVTDRRAFYTLN